MKMDNVVSSALLGIIQGLTEFLPISSTGHLILFQRLLHFQAPPGKIFECVVQLGSVLAVLFAYFERLIPPIKRLASSGDDRRFFTMILIATIPAGILGFLFHAPIKAVLYNHITVALSLIIGGFFFLKMESWQKTTLCNSPEDVRPWQASVIGTAQAIALIPGVSRSGATIASGVLVGMSHRAATEFSFILAIPTLFGAGFYDLFANRQHLTLEHATSLTIGFTTAFLASLLVFRPLVRCIDRYGFTPFAWYRIVLGILVLIF